MDTRPIKLFDTKGLSEKQFSEMRQQIASVIGGVSIGGSDVSTIFGLNPWKSPQELYAEKTGVKMKVNYERNEFQKAAGHALEEAVAQLTKLWYKNNEPHLSVTIFPDDGMYQCGALDKDGELLYPFAVANLDRIININGKNGVLECKTTTVRNKKVIAEWQAGIVPVYYELQCRYYMAVRNLNYAVIACIWGTTANDMAVITIRRDMQKEKILMDTVKSFARHIFAKTEPNYAKCDPELVADYYTKVVGMVDETKESIQITGHEEEVRKTMELDRQIREKQEELNELMNKKQDIYNLWYPIFEDHHTGFCKLDNGNTAIITLKSSYKKAKLDESKLMTEKPDLYNAYAYKFDTTQFKKDHPIEYAKYLSPKELNPDKPNSFEVKTNRTIITKGGKAVEVFM